MVAVHGHGRRTKASAFGCRLITPRYAAARAGTVAAVLSLEFDRRLAEIVAYAVLCQESLEPSVLL